ncbi:uncharacterized protein LOC121905402 [Thunnus maccoyii]|uniref:uncharacterized protein LOC121905402 n=1 Tax=Thunnus maccoyii TaxID=8240 RepID=UPI001C4AC821|nr:uncharacterized protein LOC121905402 [Thunnus maccoyii]
MFVLILAALLFSVRSNHADTGASAGQGACGDKRYCITLSEVEITAEAGLCVVIPCNFTIADNFIVKRVIWYKCDQGKTKCDSDIIFDTNNINKNQTGRVSLLEPDLSKKNCSIIINDLTKSDSGSYQLRVNGTGKQDGYTFPHYATISVKDLSSKPKVMVPVLIEGRQNTLTCTAPGLCSGSVPTITWMWRGTGPNKTKIENLTAVTQTHSSTLTFNSSAEHHGTDITCKVSFTGNKTTEETVTLNVTYIKITGNTTVKKGDALNLTCSVVGFSPSSITWTEPSSNKKHNGTKTDMHNNTGSDLKNDTEAKLKDDTGTKGGTDTQNKTVTQMQKTTGALTLIIPRMSSEHSGRYICTAKYLNTTLTKYADITVNWYPEILNNSTCKKSSRSKVVTCVCISKGLPLPTITWPLVKNHTEYSVITTVSKHTVNSTITVSVTDHSNTTIKCVSRNYIGEAERNFTIKINESEQDDLLWKLLETVIQPQVIIAFLIGIFLSAIICCLARKCHRKKQKSYGNLAESLEMETIQAVPLMPIDAGQAVEDDVTHNQEAAEGGAEAAGQWNVEPKEVEYSTIDIFMLKRKSPAQETQDATETEYAEIKREEKEERQDNGGEEPEMLDGNEEVMIEEDKEIRQCMLAEEEGGQDVVMCSDMTEILTTEDFVLWRDRPAVSRMFVLIWATLLLSVRGSIADAATSPGKKGNCQNGLCITLSEASTAEVGLCVILRCSLPDDFTLENVIWYKFASEKNSTAPQIILHYNKTNQNVQTGFRGRVSLLEPDLTKRDCSIIINDLTKSDSGSYQVSINGLLNGTMNRSILSNNASITVKDLSQKPTVTIPPLTEGQQTTLTCTAPGLCSGSVPTITWTWRGTGENTQITGNRSTLTFNSSAEHHGTKVTCKVSFTGNKTTEETVTLNVTYVRKLKIHGTKAVPEGDAVNLTCSIDSFPPSLITWTKLGSNKTLHKGITTELQSNMGMASLVIPNMTAEHSGQYICTAKHLNNTLMERVDITLHPNVLNSSGCVAQSEVLTCVCISQGVPLPAIKWPLLENHTDYSVITTVSNHTVNSTVVLTLKDHSNATVECVSRNKNGEVKGDLVIINKEQGGQVMKMLRTVTQLEVIIAFFTGALFSVTFCCLVRKCHRKKQSTHEHLAETLEMVTSQEDPLIHAGETVEDYQTHNQEAAEEGAAGKSDVEYSNINVLLLKRKSPTKARNFQETTETEYTEIKKDEAEGRQDGDSKEEEVMIEEEETKDDILEEKEGADVALYSNVKDIMGQI